MIIRNSASFLLWSAIVFSTNTIAKEIAIYRWVDENNVVHFSQHQPKGDNYTQLSTVSSYRARDKELPNKSTPTSLEEQLSQDEKNKAEVLAKNEEIAKKNCQTAILNEKMLNSTDKIMINDTEGKDRALSKEERKVQLTLSKEHIELYCEKEETN